MASITTKRFFANVALLLTTVGAIATIDAFANPQTFASAQTRPVSTSTVSPRATDTRVRMGIHSCSMRDLDFAAVNRSLAIYGTVMNPNEVNRFRAMNGFEPDLPCRPRNAGSNSGSNAGGGGGASQSSYNPDPVIRPPFYTSDFARRQWGDWEIYSVRNGVIFRLNPFPVRVNDSQF